MGSSVCQAIDPVSASIRDRETARRQCLLRLIPEFPASCPWWRKRTDRPMDVASLSAFLAVVVSSGAVLLPATLGAIVTELSGATNLGVEGIMLFGAMVAYGTAFTTGDAVLGVIAGSLAGGLLSLTHAIPVVYGRMSQERQLVLGLILVYLGDALSRLLGTPYISKASKALDVRWVIPGLSDLPVVGEVLFRQYGLVYWAYALAAVLTFVLYKTRLGLHLRATGEDPAAADAASFLSACFLSAAAFLSALRCSNASAAACRSSGVPALSMASFSFRKLISFCCKRCEMRFAFKASLYNSPSSRSVALPCLMSSMVF
jgi:ABC-type uncharacterized transport system permease subunit